MLKSCDKLSESGKTSKSSILKSANSSLRQRLNETLSKTQSKVRFSVPASKKIVNILKNFLNGIDEKEYERLIVMLLDANLDDDDVHRILQEATQLISLLNQDLRLFVEALISIKWMQRSKGVVEEYQSFLLNLISAHNYHAKFAIDSLISHFLADPDDPDWPNGEPTDEHCLICVNIHSVLSVLLNVVPMCNNMLLQSLVNHFPYYKKSSHIHEYYVHNLLWILEYYPQFRPDILHLIFSKLVNLDVNAPREEIEKAEDDDEMFSMDGMISHDCMKLPAAHTLDICLDKVLNYVVSECYIDDGQDLNWESTKALYQDMLKVFDEVILPTYNTHHVQFVMFVICSLKATISEAFLNYLWKKVSTPNIPVVIRQAAVSYVASLIARGTFIPIQMLKGTLQQMATWLHSYIANQDGLECINSDIRLHAVFYSVCQSLFYVVAFRQKDLFNRRKNITFLESLNLAKIVTSRLNPLRVCQTAVVKSFAAVTRKYQLAYCYSIMEHNARNVLPIVYQDEKGSLVEYQSTLQAFFPFDPYILNRSGKKIIALYLNYQGGIEDADVDSKRTYDVEDDFINEAKRAKFSYGTSPGFKQ